jgi:2-polyprenyl-3-methyl-5-hydroxy-6-metoxy-1,4-benzoquinol methylase
MRIIIGRFEQQFKQRDESILNREVHDLPNGGNEALSKPARLPGGPKKAVEDQWPVIKSRQGCSDRSTAGMNRRERRATVARNRTVAGSNSADLAALLAQARLAYQQRQFGQTEAICRKILASNSAHPTALNLLGVTYQATGRHELAVKMLAKAIAADDLNAACHYNIASSYQILNRRADAAIHFKSALALGMNDKVIENFLMQNPDVIACVNRAMAQSTLPVTAELFGTREIYALANDVFLRCAMQSTLLRGVELEFLLTHLRFALLRLAQDSEHKTIKLDDDTASMFCALAEQCFINEYVFAQSERETQEAAQIREVLQDRLSAGHDIPSILLAAVAAYFPLHGIANAKLLLTAERPQYVADLLVLQIREPLEEAEDCRTIPALTAIDDATSLVVMQQYEENPYPRWTLNSHATYGGEMERHVESVAVDKERPSLEILIAGCGTGRHAFHVAEQSPEAHILAIDISRPSLAYARRKTKAAGLRNIDYAQADILKLSGIGRTFDRIEAVGVLHHLAEPAAGWRMLLSLLKPNGILRLGFYSETARRTIVEARKLIVEAAYQPTPEGIRALRQTIIANRNDPRWQTLLATAEELYSMSGCRDLLFNVMEHRYTIPQIEEFLKEHDLSFLGFELEAGIAEQFQDRYPGSEADKNLGYWDVFEKDKPDTFRRMYIFSVRKNQQMPQ